ncbi:hypothetical protein LTR56_020595 [Elasticomyces elasticus]|nr:hypothetical protein LTR56_020595 [Elasticomyces elasticus]KAK3630882.1 hypothetical protein LTR22_021334 [Elasticomyces elasticus]KAK4909286.1 hypothetical protein LTR49_021956 [Elasticomyces elasticus]KAK5753564.1 hypothetical protein LTS12_016404 [Elasticomyces elasticus]
MAGTRPKKSDDRVRLPDKAASTKPGSSSRVEKAASVTGPKKSSSRQVAKSIKVSKSTRLPETTTIADDSAEGETKFSAGSLRQRAIAKAKSEARKALREARRVELEAQEAERIAALPYVKRERERLARELDEKYFGDKSWRDLDREGLRRHMDKYLSEFMAGMKAVGERDCADVVEYCDGDPDCG